MLDMLVPGGGEIITNVNEITASLKIFTSGLGKGEARTDIADHAPEKGLEFPELPTGPPILLGMSIALMGD